MKEVVKGDEVVVTQLDDCKLPDPGIIRGGELLKLRETDHVTECFSHVAECKSGLCVDYGQMAHREAPSTPRSVKLSLPASLGAGTPTVGSESGTSTPGRWSNTTAVSRKGKGAGIRPSGR